MATIDDIQLQPILSKTVVEVFRTMAAMHLDVVDASTGTESAGEHVVGAVQFVGAATGMVYIHVPIGFARSITAAIFHLKVVENDEDINDVMGEVSNMIGGRLKSYLTVSGLPCALSAPLITRGDHLKIESTGDGARQQVIFQPRGHDCLVIVNVVLARDKAGDKGYPKHPKDIAVRVINRGVEDGSMKGIVTTVEAPLSSKLSDYVTRLGHASAHLTGIIIQLLTQGKVQVDFSEHTERMELVNPEDRVDSVQAMNLLEDYLARMAPPSMGQGKSKKITQSITLDDSKTGPK